MRWELQDGDATYVLLILHQPGYLWIVERAGGKTDWSLEFRGATWILRRDEEEFARVQFDDFDWAGDNTIHSDTGETVFLTPYLGN